MIMHNTRPVPLVALDAAEWFDVEVTEDLARSQWERDAITGLLSSPRPIETDAKRSTRAHPRSYRPDCPLGGYTYSQYMHPTKAEERAELAHALAREVNFSRCYGAPAPVAAEYGADHSEVRKGPHPRSYRPDSPLTGYSDAVLTRATKADKEAWLARPLVYVRPVAPLPDTVRLAA